MLARDWPKRVTWPNIPQLKLGNIRDCYIAGVFSRYSAPIHWLVHSHMTSNNETVSRQMHERATLRKLWRQTGNSSLLPGQQFTADRCCTWWLESQRGFQILLLFCFAIYTDITNHLMTGPEGNSEFCFPRISMFPSTSSRETLRFSGNKIHCSPRDQPLSVYCYIAGIHWLVHGHMTSNNETVSRQMPWVGNIAKTMTSNGKQFTVTREMLTAVARDRWNLSLVCFCFV